MRRFNWCRVQRLRKQGRVAVASPFKGTALRFTAPHAKTYRDLCRIFFGIFGGGGGGVTTPLWLRRGLTAPSWKWLPSKIESVKRGRSEGEFVDIFWRVEGFKGHRVFIVTWPAGLCIMRHMTSVAWHRFQTFLFLMNNIPPPQQIYKQIIKSFRIDFL